MAQSPVCCFESWGSFSAEVAVLAADPVGVATAAAVLVAAPAVVVGRPAAGNRFSVSRQRVYRMELLHKKSGCKVKSYYILCFSQICYNI